MPRRRTLLLVPCSRAAFPASPCYEQKGPGAVASPGRLGRYSRGFTRRHLVALGLAIRPATGVGHPASPWAALPQRRWCRQPPGRSGR